MLSIMMLLNVLGRVKILVMVLLILMLIILINISLVGLVNIMNMIDQCHLTLMVMMKLLNITGILIEKKNNILRVTQMSNFFFIYSYTFMR